MRFRCGSLSVLLLATAAPVFAADTAPAVADAKATDGDAPDIVVTGQRGQYGARSTATATKTNTDIKNIPQAMTVISKAQIEDQDLRSIGELMNFVPGASAGTGEGNRDTITLRGNSSTADFFVDGIRDDVQYFRDFYNVDRVEVLRGSNAMIFGRGGGGGIVNRVTKRATFSTDRSFAVTGDSYGGYRLTADVDQALSSGAGVRINGLYENGDSFRHHVDLKRYGINPTVGFLAGPDTRIDLSYEYFHDRRTADRGVPSIAGKPLKGHDNDFFGDPDDSVSKADVNVGTFALQHDFGGGLTLRNRTLYGDYDKFYQNIYPGGPVLGATTTPIVRPERVTLGAYNNRTHRTNLISQTDLIWENRLGGIDQTLLVGFEVGRQRSRSERNTGQFARNQQTGEFLIDPVTGLASNEVALSDPTRDVDLPFSPSSSDPNNRTRATVGAIYAQDQIRISPMLEIVAGIRFDSFKLKFNDLRAGKPDFARKDNLVSPRLGVILKPQSNLSVYGSYSRSYLPQSGDQFGSLTADTDALKPERFDNYEVGAKWEPVAGLLATAAIYKLDRTNTRATDPVTLLTVLTGAQRSKGLELGLERSMTDRWQIAAGYGWQKAEITKTTASAPAGREVPLVPRHTFSLWNRYDVTTQLGLGLGLIARSKSYTSISNSVILPSYARVDAAGYYKITPKIQAQVNVENLLGADCFPTTNGDNNIAPGAPRTIRATLRFGI